LTRSTESIRKAIGQLFIVGFDGTEPDKDLRDLLRHYSPGGLILFKRNLEDPDQILRLTRGLQDPEALLPRLVCVDQEGGRVWRLPLPFTPFPEAQTLGNAGLDSLAHSAAKVIAEQLAAVGIHCNFAPVLDLHTNPENPVIMDEILEALGAEVIDWSYKVDCCGGSLSIAAPEIVEKLSGKIVDASKEAGADAIVSACGICQLNLDMRQPKDGGSPPVPILYFSELSALALGSKNFREWANKHFVDPSNLMQKLELI